MRAVRYAVQLFTKLFIMFTLFLFLWPCGATKAMLTRIIEDRFIFLPIYFFHVHFSFSFFIFISKGRFVSAFIASLT